MSVPFLDIGAMNDEVRPELDALWGDVVDSSGFVGGHYVETFERAWADYCEVSHAVGVANGTDALQLTLTALGIGPGDEVIVPANTFIATAASVAMVGASVVFVDVDPSTLLMTARTLAAAITPRTAAVIPVHLYGQPVDMESLLAVADAAGIAVIEDAAQAHGARWSGQRIGSFGRAACFSFYPGKNLGALGDAGAVVTNDPDLAERVRRLSNHGRGQGKYTHHVVGTNSRLDNLQAAMLLVKLSRLDAWNTARRAAAARYDELLSSFVELTEQRPEAESVHHLYVIRTEDRDTLKKRLHDDGIASGLHYPIPCHLQPPYIDSNGGPLPVVEGAAHRILSLPMFPHMSETQIEATARAVQDHVLSRKEAAIA